MSDSVAESATTQRLLNEIRNGNAEAADELFRRHRTYLREVVEMRFNTPLKRRMDASDIVQDTTIEALRRLEDFAQEEAVPFRLWLRRLANERLIMAQRRHYHAARRAMHREVPLPERTSLVLAAGLRNDQSTPGAQQERQELAKRVQEAVGQLTEIDRDILLMLYHEGLTSREIGYVLNMKTNTVIKRHGRALVRLREILSPHDD